jgi:hypothetical protein
MPGSKAMAKRQEQSVGKKQAKHKEQSGSLLDVNSWNLFSFNASTPVSTEHSLIPLDVIDSLAKGPVHTGARGTGHMPEPIVPPPSSLGVGGQLTLARTKMSTLRELPSVQRLGSNPSKRKRRRIEDNMEASSRGVTVRVLCNVLFCVNRMLCRRIYTTTIVCAYVYSFAICLCSATRLKGTAAFPT